MKRIRYIAVLIILCLLLTFVITVLASAPISGSTTEFVDDGQSLGTEYSNSVELGDLDGDGDLDAFVTNYYVSGTSPGINKIWMNNNGTFSDSGQNLGTARSERVALGDVDKDGDLDAFVVNSSQPNIVWLNNGSGVFTDSGQALGSSNSWDVKLADLDGDGDLDAFVANLHTGNKVWLNDGSGVFTDSGQSLGSSISYEVALEDFDSDGDIDAFVTNGNRVNKVWLNDGNAIFTDSGQSLGTTDEADWGIASGDIDGDGDLDIFVSVYNSSSNRANQVWLNNGSGVFTDSGQTLGSSASFHVSLGDIDSDGDLDAYVSNSNSANKIWLNDGAGNFSDSGESMGSSRSEGVALGDVDGDGDLDAFVANYASANKIWRNDCVHRNTPFSDSGQSLGSAKSVGVAIGDLDGNGTLDAFIANHGAQANKVWMGDGAGSFSDSTQSLGSATSYGVELGDLDSDGDLDAFVANWSAANRIWVNNSGTFSGGQSVGSGYNSRDVALGDVDSDGDLDAFVVNDGSANKVYTNTLGAFADSGQNLGSANSRDVVLSDLDGDGDLDAYVANSGADNVYFNSDVTPGTFTQVQSLGSSDGYSVALGDLDRDGDLDAFVVGGGGNRVWINDGSGTFSSNGQNLGNSYSIEVTLGDLDGDGDLDAYVANYNNAPNKVWYNNGSGIFSDSGQNIGGSYSHSAVLGDLDGDGDLDAFVANYNQANKVWRNIGGSAGLTVTDTSPGSYILDGIEDDVFQIDFTHNGISSDHDLELNYWNLDLLSSDCSTPLTSAQANQYLTALRVRLDDGDSTFETSDTLVGVVTTFALDANGTQMVSFANDDSNVQVTGTNSKIYWISLEAAVDQGQLGICVNFDPDADALVEGKTPDFSVSVQDSDATNTGNVPTAITLHSLTARTGVNVTAALLLGLLSMITIGLVLTFQRHS